MDAITLALLRYYRVLGLLNHIIYRNLLNRIYLVLIGKVGKNLISKLGKVSKIGKISKVSKIGKVGKIGKVRS